MQEAGMEMEPQSSPPAPSRRVRMLFWLILGALSTFFAEVVCGSAPFALVDGGGLLLVLPLYGLHTLVLGTLVLGRPGRVSFGALFLAGVLFGLYEGYITKVLWNPPWDAEAFRLGGVAVLSTLMLALFWHPFMAFIVPLFAGECLLTGSS